MPPYPDSCSVIEVNNGLDYLAYREGSGGTVEVYDLAVNSERGRGVGRLMVNTLLDRVRGRTHLVWALTRQSNYGARAFYAKMGFTPLSTMPMFYREESAIMYCIYITVDQAEPTPGG